MFSVRVILAFIFAPLVASVAAVGTIVGLYGLPVLVSLVSSTLAGRPDLVAQRLDSLQGLMRIFVSYVEWVIIFAVPITLVAGIPWYVRLRGSRGVTKGRAIVAGSILGVCTSAAWYTSRIIDQPSRLEVDATDVLELAFIVGSPGAIGGAVAGRIFFAMLGARHAGQADRPGA